MLREKKKKKKKNQGEKEGEQKKKMIGRIKWEKVSEAKKNG